MKAKNFIRVVVVQHLLIYLCLADNQYWIVQQLKPDKSCTKNCAGRRVRYYNLKILKGISTII